MDIIKLLSMTAFSKQLYLARADNRNVTKVGDYMGDFKLNSGKGQPRIASRYLRNPRLDVKKGLLYFDVKAATKPCDAGALLSRTRFVASSAFGKYVSGLGFKGNVSGILLNRMNITSPNNQWSRVCSNKARMAVDLSHYRADVLKAIAQDFGAAYAPLKAVRSKYWGISARAMFNAYSSTRVYQVSIKGRVVTKKETVRETYSVPQDAKKWVRALDKLMVDNHFSLTQRRKIWKRLGGKEKLLKAAAVKRVYQILLKEVQRIDRKSGK